MVRFLSEDIRASLDQEAFCRCVESAMPPAWRDLDDLGRAQELEIASFMVPYLLSSQGDRMLMANGVEGRYPFLDGALAAEAALLRSEERLVGLREKPLLRRIARRLLPREIAERPKWPYRSPMQRAFFGVDAPDFVRDALSDTRLRAHPLIDGPAATRLAQRAFTASATKPLSEREEMAAFGLLTLVLWHERFVEHASFAIAVDQRESAISIFKHDACACSEECFACSEDER
jgi:asparagine synthase (glutamine-hydrolysing)